MEKSMGFLTDVNGIKVGHYTSSVRPTGCTVILAEPAATAGVDIRGGAPGSRETALLNPLNTVPTVHAIALAGGSAFGLDVASGVTRFLEERGIGFDVRVARVPIVPSAIIFDLQLGDSRIRPTAEDGYQAAQSAVAGHYELGNVGAGAGATVGKLFGPHRAMRGGLGSASVKIGSLVVAALAVVNAGGDIIDPDSGKLIAGARSEDGRSLTGIIAALRAGARPGVFAPPDNNGALTNTTLGVVATNACLTKTEATKVAQMAHDGLARAINPVHTPFDGDTVFALATNELSGPSDLTTIGALAADTLARAIVGGVLSATSYQAIPCAREFGLI